MEVLRYIFIVLVFVCIFVGFALVLFNKAFISKKKYTEQVAERKSLKLKLIGYIFFMLALAFAIFQGLMIN